MAVRIVSEAPVKKVTCKACYCVLEYAYNDTRTDISYDYLGDPSEFRYITCPNCKNPQTVPFNF